MREILKYQEMVFMWKVERLLYSITVWCLVKSLIDAEQEFSDKFTKAHA